MAATYDQIVELLQSLPAASPSWAHGLFTARLSIQAVDAFLSTMLTDSQSPLRRAEEGVLAQEVLRINQARGDAVLGNFVPGKLSVKLRVVLSASEQVRVTRIVQGFCQPIFETSGRFGKNGHAVLNAVRRATKFYNFAKVPVGAPVIEVGPDVKDWLLSPTLPQWSGDNFPKYKAARPVITPRDSLRVTWQTISSLIDVAREGFFSSDVVEKKKKMDDFYESIFEKKKIQDVDSKGEYIISNDSNYDIKFSDMPVVMAATGARAWYGVMNRAKGLTSETRLTQGKLDLMGTTYRVSWDSGRIDYRHPECATFGYSHDVWEFMRYEQHNGYVWTTNDCHYIYGKGPETTDELLFFHVVRVPKLHNMVEPRFVDKPYAGYVAIRSIWAVGEDSAGLPTSFSEVYYHVDALNFSKILEKRRCLDHKGDLAVTVGLVRSTNVKFWLNGTYVSVNKKIEAKLTDATAVFVEALAAKNRLESNLIFSRAMTEFQLSVKRDGWLIRCLESIVDLKAISGSIAMPIMRIWTDVRSSIIDKLLGPISDVSVGYQVVDSHVCLVDENREYIDVVREVDVSPRCKCSEVAEVRAAILGASEDQKVVLQSYLSSLLSDEVCEYCVGTSNGIAFVAQDDVGQIQPCDRKDSNDSGYDSESVVGSDHPSVVEVSEGTWSDDQFQDSDPVSAMQEFIALEHYLSVAQLSEIRIDSTRIVQRGPITDQSLAEFATTRTKHMYLVVQGNRVVRKIGFDFGDVSAVYDPGSDKIVSVRMKGNVMCIDLPNGNYYTCNRLKVWNSNELIQSVEHALSYGNASAHRARIKVCIGVPGAGKTYACVESIAKDYFLGKDNFLYLGVTTASVRAAKGYADSFGIPFKVAESRFMTLDSYLMHRRFPVSFFYGDEYSGVHFGKWDAAISISAAQSINLYGDARQIEYDPFCAEFVMRFAKLGKSVSASQITFMPKTHRLRKDVCAMWLDRYPSIYPCDCCDVEGKDEVSLSYERVVDLTECPYVPDVRYHTYRQEEKEQLKDLFGIQDDFLSLRSKQVGGMATVHEDQGSTHDKVVNVRLHADYDKKASKFNPSLYNKLNYVLTDTTRHVKSYHYVTCSDEDDEICKRIRMSTSLERLSLVDAKQGMGYVTLLDMI